MNELVVASTFRCFGVHFSIEHDDTLGALDCLLEALRSDGTADLSYQCASRASGPISVQGPELPATEVDSLVDAVGLILATVHVEAVRRTIDLLLFHAGGVLVGGTGVLLPGPSGVGKSTMVASLLSAGNGYLSDELVGVDRQQLTLVPYPKPLSMKAEGITLLGNMMPTVSPSTNGGEILVPMHAVRTATVAPACEPGLIVFPCYVGESAPDGVDQLTASEALARLVENAVNFDVDPDRSLTAVHRLVHRCPSYEVRVSSLEQGRDAVLTLVANI